MPALSSETYKLPFLSKITFAGLPKALFPWRNPDRKSSLPVTALPLTISRTILYPLGVDLFHEP